MGSTSNEGKVHFWYTDEFMALWNMMSDYQLGVVNTIGKKLGWSGQQVLYLALISYMLIRYMGVPAEDFEWQKSVEAQ